VLDSVQVSGERRAERARIDRGHILVHDDEASFGPGPPSTRRSSTWRRRNWRRGPDSRTVKCDRAPAHQRLRLRDDDLAADDRVGLHDGDSSGVEVDIGPRQPHQLAPAHAGGRHEQPDRTQAVALDLDEELSGLGDVPDLYLRSPRPRRLGSICRVGGETPPAEVAAPSERQYPRSFSAEIDQVQGTSRASVELLVLERPSAARP